MDTLNIPEEGVTLHGAPGSARSEDTSKPPSMPLQAMRLELEHGVLDNVLRTAQSGGKGVHLSFGKTITLDYGNRSKQLSATVQNTPTELYSYTDGKENEITFTALQSHRLVMKKAQEETLGADVALAKLQNQLASAEREKQARQIQLAPNNISLPPALPRRNAAKASKALSAMRPNTNSQHRSTNNAHSGVNSPSLLAARSPHNLEAVFPEPLVEDAKAQKAKALKVPLIHFLAVRPVSEKYLGQTLGCDQKDLHEVLQKVGKPYRLDQSKWDLNDRAFKELDLWQFNYPTADDRQRAIDRAVSSFDRQRLSRSDPLWQKLLPYHERNKGKVLSNLNLGNPKAQRDTTPRIHVQSTDDSVIARQTSGHDSDARQDRLAPSDAEPKAKSKAKSGKSLTVSNGGEHDVRSKGPLSKEPKKVDQTTKAKEGSQGKPSGNKKGAKKAAAPKVAARSSEFVHDSDEEDDEDVVSAPASKIKPSTQQATPTVKSKSSIEEDDDGMADVPVAKVQTSTPKPIDAMKRRAAGPEAPKPVKSKPVAKAARNNVATAHEVQDYKKPTGSPAKVAEKRPPSLGSSSSSSKGASSESNQASNPMSKSLSRQRTTSSPHKPSPLGSSPPTNASDLDNDSRPISSTSSTPLIAQVRAPQPGNTKQLSGATRDESTPMKTLNGPRKRKATDEDTDIHDIDPPLTNGSSMTNGHFNSAKRYKISPISPPTSDSSVNSGTNARRQVLEQAQRFKTFWGKYRALYTEVAALPKDVPNKKFDDLMRMHERLEGMKYEIAKAAPG